MSMESKLNNGKGLFTFKDVQEGYPDYINIVKDIPDEVIYNFYLGFYPSLNQKFKSPFKQEKDPSFCFFIKNGKVLYKDFSTGAFGDSVELVKQLYSIDYINAIKKICKDIKSMRVDNNPIKYKKLDKKDTEKSTIEVVIRDFNKFDLEYWNQYYITKELLEKYDIKACKEVWLNDKPFYVYKKNNPSYRFKIGKLYKVYQPLSENKKTKWLSNFDLDIIQGFTQLRYNNTLIITKSYKDIIILNEFYNKSVIALNSEGNHIPDKILNYLKLKFNNIICFYDNDEAGIKYMERNKEVYGFEYCYFKEKFLKNNIKDPSDYIKQYGVLSFNEIKEDLVYSNKKVKDLI